MPKDTKEGKKGKDHKPHKAGRKSIQSQSTDDGKSAARFDMLAAQMSQLRAKGMQSDQEERNVNPVAVVSTTIADPDAETYLPDDIEDNLGALAFLDQAVVRVSTAAPKNNARTDATYFSREGHRPVSGAYFVISLHQKPTKP